MRHTLVVAVTIAGILSLLFVAVGLGSSNDSQLSTESIAASPPLSSGDPATAAPRLPVDVFRTAINGGLDMEVWDVVRGDTIRYRVCKDLSICYVEVPSPAPGIATPEVPLTAGSPLLAPVEVLSMPQPVIVQSRWGLLGLPLLGLAGYALLGDSEFVPGREQETGGSQPPAPEPPGTVPPTVIPEPTSLILLATGLAGVAMRRLWGKREDEDEE